MDETVMLDWIDLILEPYVAQAPEGIVPVLFLDSYRAHMMKSVVTRIQALGVEVFHIPGGCTGLCQPVDVGFNKPLKSRIRSEWEEWMNAKWDGLQAHEETPKPTRLIVSEWVLQAFDDFPERLIRNAWTKTGYAWFDRRLADIVEEEDIGDDDYAADDDDDDLVLRMSWSLSDDASSSLSPSEGSDMASVNSAASGTLLAV